MIYVMLGIDTLLGGILVTTALYTIQLYIMGGGNRSLGGVQTLPGVAERAWDALHLPDPVVLAGTSVPGAQFSSLAVFAAWVLFSTWVLARFLRTDLGLALRSAGGNAQGARARGRDPGRMMTRGLVLANGLVALAGALFAQYQGFANVSMGIGMIVSGLACLVLGEGLLGRATLRRQITGTLCGTIAFRLLVALALVAGLPPDALKLATAVFVLGALVIPSVVTRVRRRLESAVVRP
jgi:putative ABC transport system permease protein